MGEEGLQRLRVLGRLADARTAVGADHHRHVELATEHVPRLRALVDDRIEAQEREVGVHDLDDRHIPSVKSYTQCHTAEAIFCNGGADDHLIIREGLRRNCSAVSFGTCTHDRGRVLNTGLILNKEGYGTQHSLNRIFTKNLLSENGGAPV